MEVGGKREEGEKVKDRMGGEIGWLGKASFLFFLDG